MPFFAQVREKILTQGISATALGVDFDERQILELNAEYLRNTLDLESIDFKFTDDPTATEKMREDVQPGLPLIAYFTKPSLKLTLENPVPRSGHFTEILNVSEGDTIKGLREKLAKKLKIEEINAVKIFRFNDPILGPRKMPIFNDYKTGKSALEDGIISIDTKTENVQITSNDGKKIEIGTNLVYVVE